MPLPALPPRKPSRDGTREVTERRICGENDVAAHDPVATVGPPRGTYFSRRKLSRRSALPASTWSDALS